MFPSLPGGKKSSSVGLKILKFFRERLFGEFSPIAHADFINRAELLTVLSY
jgi:hypothetical protein